MLKYEKYILNLWRTEKMKSSTVRIGKRIMAVMLSLMMVVGVFAGMKLDTKAAGRESRVDELKKGMVLYAGDVIIIPAVEGMANRVSIDTVNYKNPLLGTGWMPMHSDPNGKEMRITLRVYKYEGTEYDSFTFNYTNITDIEKMKRRDYYIDFSSYSVSSSEVNNTNNTQTPIASYSHTCSFQWVTIIDPQVGMDGLEEYKCVECGAVQESHSIPASVAAVKDFYGKIKEAPENGSITYDSGKLYTISDYLLKKMSERNDVTLTVNFEYQNAKYELTFPAGTDFTPVLTDEETMYGYFGVAAKLGLTVAAK